MKIESGSTVAGVLAMVLREALRKNQFCEHNLHGFALLLNVSSKAASSLLPRLESKGFLQRKASHEAWENTTKGNAFACASAAPRISRSTADKALTELISRASAINSDPKYAYVVGRITVFGSYLSEVPRLSDVDVCIELRRRYSDQALQEAVEAEAKKRNPIFHTFLDDIARPEREVWKLLKAHRRALQIVAKIPEDAKRKVVFEEKG